LQFTSLSAAELEGTQQSAYLGHSGVTGYKQVRTLTPTVTLTPTHDHKSKVNLDTEHHRPLAGTHFTIPWRVEHHRLRTMSKENK